MIYGVWFRHRAQLEDTDEKWVEEDTVKYTDVNMAKRLFDSAFTDPSDAEKLMYSVACALRIPKPITRTDQDLFIDNCKLLRADYDNLKAEKAEK